MPDNASDYPAALDPNLAVLEGQVDFVPLDALQFAINALAAIQGAVGVDATNFTGLGGDAPDYGTIGSLLLALFRIESGTATMTTVGNGDVYPVAFTAGRFSAPPYVMLQLRQNSEPGADAIYSAKKITQTGFEIGTGHGVPSTFSGTQVDWLAVQPVFGAEQDIEV